MSNLNQAVIVLTGASGGFGQQLTRQLLQSQSRLILTDINETSLREQTANIQKDISTGEVLGCWGVDLSTSEGCNDLYDKVRALNIPVDILINNAGIALFGRMDEVPSGEWDRLMQVNLMTPMRLSSLFVADMIARRKGHIVNISSLAGWIAIAGLAHYSASKFGLRGFSEGLFNEVKQYNVKVTAVYPFFSRTPLLKVKTYGALAEEMEEFPEWIATDPERVMRKTIKGIKQNKLHVFPDKTARSLHLLKQYFPLLVNWGSYKINRIVKTNRHE